MSIKRNFIYNSVLTVSGYVFTLLTYPYVSRVLGLSNIGIVNFVDGLINYFILFAMMGTTTLGIREIAINKSNKDKLSKAFSGILLLNGITTLLAAIVLLISMHTVPQLIPHKNILYIGVCKLIFNLFLTEWLFTGMENFAYITKRSIAIKLFYMVSVFLFIQKPSDYQLYYLLCVLTVMINGIVNIIYSHKYVMFTLKGIHIKPYLNTFFSVGLYIIISSMYTSFNVAWLGMTVGTDEVGYYTTATKFHAIILALLSAFQNVMFPRVTSLLSEGKMTEYREKLKISVDSLLAFCIPTIIISIIFGPDILHFLVGDGFEGSYLPFRIIMPLILIIGYEQIICIQVLLAMKQERKLLYNSCLGAFVGLLLNFIIVKHLGAVGSSLVWLSSEFAVMVGAQYLVFKTAHFSFPWKMFFKYGLAYLPAVIVLLGIYQYCNYSDIIMIIIAMMFTAAYTIVVQTKILKNSICLQLFQRVFSHNM